MKRILTGIQSSRMPHLGNILGGIQPALRAGKSTKERAFFFIADLHTLTSQYDPKVRQELTYQAAATWLAMGLDLKKDLLYRQSHVPMVCELMWYLSACTPYPMLANAHAFKDKSKNLAHVNAGLFTYPILMAADILLYDPTHIPTGKDQKQHLEIARDIAQKANHYYGENLFTLPEALISKDVPILPGTDGRKMSKSYHNTIDPFGQEATLRQQVMHIQTDSTPLAAPKDPDRCPIVALYQILATAEEVQIMRKNYLQGGYGYGEAKKTLLALLLEKFQEERKAFAHYMAHPQHLETILQEGEKKASAIAASKMQKVRKAFGF